MTVQKIIQLAIIATYNKNTGTLGYHHRKQRGIEIASKKCMSQVEGILMVSHANINNFSEIKGNIYVKPCLFYYK